MSSATQLMVKWPACIVLFVIITACAGTPRPTTQGPATTFDQRADPLPNEQLSAPGPKALEFARKMLDTPYRYGGNDPRGFDCSGLVQYAFNLAGIKLPRSSQDIFRASQRINPQDIRPGDLVFFAISSDKVSHVGIYADRNRFIHAPSSGKGVSFASIENPYWQKRLVGAGRL